jgi:aminobenzoyl-glutamate utilization protein B
MGRSALDAVELMNVGCNYLREHVIDSARIHYTTDACGCPPNIVSDYAKSWYYVRAPYMSDVKDILRRIKLVAQGAAMMTETEVEINVDSGCCEMQRNTAFADIIYDNMTTLHQEEFTKEEIEFARMLAMTLDKHVWEKEHNLYQIDRSIETEVLDRNMCDRAKINSSSDSGDVSQIMPMGLFTTACWPVGCAPHTWQTTASAGSSIGQKGMMYAAKIIAATAYDLLNSPEKLEAITQEFEENKKHYQPMV